MRISIDECKERPAKMCAKRDWFVKACSSSFCENNDEDLKVIDVTPIESLFYNVNLDKDGTGDESTLARRRPNNLEFKDLNEKMIKEEFSKGINILPKKGVKIGESWTETDNITPDGKVKSSVTYTLAKVENGIAEISIKGGIPLKSEKQTQQGVTATISIQGTQQGNITVDQNTGWIKKSTLNIKTTNKQSMTDGKQTESITQTSDSTITIN